MEFRQIYSLAKTLTKLVEAEIIDMAITRQKIKQLVSSDHFGYVERLSDVAVCVTSPSG